MKISVCHPGKIGDALYALPTIRHISKLYNCKVDFYTSEHCVPILKFMEQQDCINHAFVSSQYKIERYDMGVQPWYVPVDDTYDQVFQLGFKSVPDKSLPEYIAEQAGFDRTVGKNIYYNVNESAEMSDYIVVAPRGITPFSNTLLDICYQLTRKCSVYIIGGAGENPFIGNERNHTIDKTGIPYEDMVDLIAHSKGFMGIMSSPLVIANGFSIPKYIPYNDAWDMRHIVQRPESLYSKNPSSNECFLCFGFK